MAAESPTIPRVSAPRRVIRSGGWEVTGTGTVSRVDPVRRATVRGVSSPGDVVQEAICPYRGLDAFREEDAAFFFGRGDASEPESTIGQLVHKVREHPFVMVVGRSGSGKSSLISAGLLPALRRQRDRFWNVLSLRPGPTPLRALAAAFNPRADDEGAAERRTG